MGKFHTSRVARVADMLAVASEPGLSNSQLMLTNHDLKPGMSNPGKSQIHDFDNFRSRTRAAAMGRLELCGLLDRGFI